MKPFRKVAALYVDPKGIYPQIFGVEAWGEEEDARRYKGPYPVVAHPPCGPWGRLRFLCKHQDARLGPAAVRQVRLWGGVLEHPAHSKLWRECMLPNPDGWPDKWGGRTYAVEQVAWGHPCVKPTWIYVVGVDEARVRAGIRIGGVPTHRVTSGPRGSRLPSLSKVRVHLTPQAFAGWLVSLARVSQKPQ